SSRVLAALSSLRLLLLRLPPPPRATLFPYTTLFRSLGFTHATMAGTERGEPVRVSESLKAGLSSDRSLQFDYVKSESLVIADQQRCGEYVPGPCTHRPSSHESR